MAHIGVIEELERNGYRIVEVAGSSMGAIVGGIYCTGHLPEYKHFLVGLSKLDVFNLLDFTLNAQGFVKGERVLKAVEQLIGDHFIENFSVPFTAVAADVVSRRRFTSARAACFVPCAHRWPSRPYSRPLRKAACNWSMAVCSIRFRWMW